ncbi:MAG TPA: hypothetical protein VLH56_08915 [Dissulfurispiraceae bacterium]|nr:hypothetical protein [Dissulfurispiraceae bacterium]
MAIKRSPISGFGWNERAGRYMNLDSGRFVTFKAVKSELDSLVTAYQQDIKSLSLQFKAGDITLREWHLGMERTIKNIHVASAAAARGGWAQMSKSDWGWVGQRVRFQYEKLDAFARQIEAGTVKLNGRFLARADMYGQAGRATFEEMRRRYGRIFKDAVRERRVLSPIADHCTAGQRPGCMDLAARGWQSIGVLPPIGAATCLTHCKCRWEMQDADGNTI